MNFVFEDLNEYRNFSENWTLNFAESERFTVAPIFNRCNVLGDRKEKNFLNIKNIFHKSERPEKYIISIGVNNDPSNWAGGKFGEFADKNYPSMFDYLGDEYLQDLQNNKAFFLVDSSFEGYHEQWIFDFFHSECERLNINPRRIIFVTGNSIIEECYHEWLVQNPKEFQIKVIPYSCFEFDTFLYTETPPPANKSFPPSFEEHIIYKNLNPNIIKTFSNLNKKPRGHRKVFYSLLYTNNLLKDGLVSMNQIDDHVEFCDKKFGEDTIKKIQQTLPSLINQTSNEIFDTGYYVKRFNYDACLQSYVSVISEAQYEDSQKTVFLSEKIFKIISCSHPFIILGNKHSLRELRKLGYQTFNNWFDESYDFSSDCERYDLIIKTIKDINSIENKIKWFGEMREVVEYNKKILKMNCVERLPYAVLELQNHYYNN